MITVAIFSFSPRRGRERDEGAENADFAVDERKAVPCGLVDGCKWIVAAGVKQYDAHFVGRGCKRVEKVVETYRLDRDVRFALGVYIDWHQKVLAVDLHAVSCVEHERYGIGTFDGNLGSKLADHFPHLVFGEIGSARNLKAVIAQRLCYRTRIMSRIGQGGN